MIAKTKNKKLCAPAKLTNGNPQLLPVTTSQRHKSLNFLFPFRPFMLYPARTSSVVKLNKRILRVSHKGIPTLRRVYPVNPSLGLQVYYKNIIASITDKHYSRRLLFTSLNHVNTGYFSLESYFFLPRSTYMMRHTVVGGNFYKCTLRAQSYHQSIPISNILKYKLVASRLNYI